MRSPSLLPASESGFEATRGNSQVETATAVHATGGGLRQQVRALPAFSTSSTSSEAFRRLFARTVRSI